jgi:hypothetical protein
LCGSFRQPGVAQDRSLSLCGPQRRLSALGDQRALLLRQRRVNVQHEWIDVGTKLGNRIGACSTDQAARRGRVDVGGGRFTRRMRVPGVGPLFDVKDP